ncbi:hypothetical protein J6590_094660 [Homalodisca vitripennis]|nr:hypothetical protein J6590_094660 [Homalodisca vitripennis]
MARTSAKAKKQKQDVNKTKPEETDTNDNEKQEVNPNNDNEDTNGSTDKENDNSNYEGLRRRTTRCAVLYARSIRQPAATTVVSEICLQLLYFFQHSYSTK